jgi:uncharacterized repeat protein (TIGR01451 family)
LILLSFVLLISLTSASAPVADFTATPLSGKAPLQVSFTDLSLNSPTGWSWYFGDEDFTEAWTLQSGGSEWSPRCGHTIVALPDGSIVLMGGGTNIYAPGYDSNEVWRSTDKGATWTLVNSSPGWSARRGHTSVVLPDGSIVLMGGREAGSFFNDVWRSTDKGSTWVLVTDNPGWSRRSGHSSMAMPDGSIMLMGGETNNGIDSNDVWRSTDKGATWTLVNSSPGWSERYTLSSVAMPDGSIVLMGGRDYFTGYKNDTWRSTDNGTTWIQMNKSAGWAARDGHSSVAMPDGSIVLMGGVINGGLETNDIWRSMDNGTTWIQQTAGAGWTPREQHSSVIMADGSIVLMGGYNGGWMNDVWCSKDIGATWTQLKSSGWPLRSDHSSVALPDGKIILMGGSAPTAQNDTWQSSDKGATWTQLPTPGWPARYGHSSVTMPDGSIVLMGGCYDYGNLFNDTWRSTDNGETWHQMNASSGWSARYGHSSVVLPDGSIVLMGGGDYHRVKNDVWRSTDNGATWEQLTAIAGWAPNEGHSSVVLPDGSIVLIGGDTYSGYGSDEVWRSTDKGATWTKLPGTGMIHIYDQSSVVLPDGSIILTGGRNWANSLFGFNYVMRSADKGSTWTLLPDPGWRARYGHSSVAMPDGSIVLIGGESYIAQVGPLPMNDVWRFQPAGSSLQNPSHTFNRAGIYNVSLQAYNAEGYNSTRKTGYIAIPVGYVDLKPTGFSAIGQSDSIDGISMYWDVENTGSVIYDGTRFDAVYLSADQNLDSGDIKLSSFEENRSLNPGERHSFSELIDYSNPIEDGNYYLILNLDDKKEVLEQNELNNIIFRPLQIGSGEKFYETAAYHSSLNADMKSQNLTSENGLVTGDLSGTINLPSVDLVTISSGSFEGQGFFKGIFTANLDNFDYSGNFNGILIPDPEHGKRVLKGTISGTGMTGLFEGTLTESTPGSGVYDHLSSVWKLNRVQGTITSSTLKIDSDLSIVNEHTYSSVPLTVIQTSMSGTTFGDYEYTISTVLTHLHISDPSNPFNEKGFSTLSYSSATGQGHGWTYDTVVGSDFIDMEGSFTSPLEGVVFGTLPINQPRTLSVFLERIDLGLPTLPDLKVSISGPQRVSPGQTVDYTIEVRNDGIAAAYNVIVVDALPHDIKYFASSFGGTYRWENHEVFWTYDTVAPRSRKYVYIRGYVPWGLPGELQLNHTVYVETSGDERDTYPDKKTAVCDQNQYRDYQPSDEINIVPLTQEENDNLRNTQNYRDILSYALDLGYIDTNTSNEMIMPDGSEVTLSLLLSPDTVESPEMVFITKFTRPDDTSTDWFLYKFTNNSISLFDRSGGIAFNVNDGTTAYLGNWGEMHSCPTGACRANCYWKELGLATIGCLDFKAGSIADLFGKGFSSIVASIDCNKCKNLPPGLDRKDSCSRCAIGLIGAFPATKVPGCIASLVFETTRCEGVCRNPGTSGEYNCNPGDSRTRCSHWWNILDPLSGTTIMGIPSAITETCTSDCVWKASKTPAHCTDRYQKCDCITTAGGSSECSCDNPNKGGTTTTIAIAHDPNIKYGPEGHVAAGQILDYRIEYENVGEGIAYGVYFIDSLDEDLDAASLVIGPVYSTTDSSQIAPPGTYNPGTRTITWLAGEVGPKEGGYANISVNVRSDAPDGSEIINYGIVYFPSVPEETQTNAIVSIVGINHPPAFPATPTPADNDINVINTTGLLWNGVDSDGDTLRYDVYFGTTTPLPLLEQDTFSTISNPGILAAETTYSWQIISRDPDGAETPGPVWHFTTRSAQLPPDTGSIRVTSVPEGAEIFINNFDTKFTTPHTFADQVVGSYEVNVTLDGYVAPPSLTKNVVKGLETTFDFTLSPIPPDTGRIRVTSVPEGAEIFINGEDTGNKTPFTFNNKPVGTYHVYVTKNGYITSPTLTKSVTRDTETVYDFTLSQIPSTISPNVKIVPRIINLGSKGYFLAFVTLPDAYKSATIDMKTVSCSGATAIRMVRPKIFPRIAVFVFKTSDLHGVGVGNKVALTLNGELKNKGTTYAFTGSDTVKVISKPTWQPDDIKDLSKVSDDQLFKKYSI